MRLFSDRFFEQIRKLAPHLTSGLLGHATLYALVATLPRPGQRWSRWERNRWLTMAREVLRAVDAEAQRLSKYAEEVQNADTAIGGEADEAYGLADTLGKDVERLNALLVTKQAEYAALQKEESARRAALTELEAQRDRLIEERQRLRDQWQVITGAECIICGKSLGDIGAKRAFGGHHKDCMEEEVGDESTQGDDATPVPAEEASPPAEQPASVPGGGARPKGAHRSCANCGEHPRSFNHRSTCLLNSYGDDHDFTDTERLRAAALLKADNKTGVISVVEYILSERHNKAGALEESGHRHHWKIEIVDGIERGQCGCGAEREFTNERA